MVFERLTASEEETGAAGRDLAALLRPGDLVLLEGELGAGKTCFVRGLAEALGADPNEISSPTFSLVHEYAARDSEGARGAPPLLAHVDLYRLDDARSVRELGLDELLTRDLIVAVEWPKDFLRDREAWRVELAAEGQECRRIRISPPDPVRTRTSARP